MAAYWCFRKLGWKPSEFLDLPIDEKACIFAFLEIAAKQAKDAQSQLK